MDTLEVKAQFESKMATTGGVFYSDGAVYWAGKKLNPTTLGVLLEYQRVSDSSIWHDTICAENGFVIAEGGFYHNNIAVRLCKSPGGLPRILDDGRIVTKKTVTDSNGNSCVQFHIGLNIFA